MAVLLSASVLQFRKVASSRDLEFKGLDFTLNLTLEVYTLGKSTILWDSNFLMTRDGIGLSNLPVQAPGTVLYYLTVTFTSVIPTWLPTAILPGLGRTISPKEHGDLVLSSPQE